MKKFLIATAALITFCSVAHAYEQDVRGENLGWVKTATVDCHKPRPGTKAAFTYIDNVPCTLKTEKLVSVYDKPNGKIVRYINPKETDVENLDLVLFQGKVSHGFTEVYLPKGFTSICDHSECGE